MVPSHALRLQWMLRSLTEVILPALPREQQLALDQANILAANLRILMDQNDKAYQFRMTELREFAALTQALLQAAGGGEQTEASRQQAQAALQAAEPVAALPIPSQAELSALVLGLRAAADALLNAAIADGERDFQTAARRLVYAQSGAELLRERVWIRAAGFEAEPASLPPIEELLT